VTCLFRTRTGSWSISFQACQAPVSQCIFVVFFPTCQESTRAVPAAYLHCFLLPLVVHASFFLLPEFYFLFWNCPRSSIASPSPVACMSPNSLPNRLHHSNFASLIYSLDHVHAELELEVQMEQAQVRSQLT
jgi:hypothetical protein